MTIVSHANSRHVGVAPEQTVHCGSKESNFDFPELTYHGSTSTYKCVRGRCLRFCMAKVALYAAGAVGLALAAWPIVSW